MNSVAGQMVATMMNSNFSAIKSNFSSGKSTDDFSKVFEQVNSKNSNRYQHPVKQPSKKVENSEAVAVEVTALTEKVQKATEEIKSEVTEVKAEKSIEDVEKIYEEVIEVISDKFGIPIEELQSFLDANHMKLLDLSELSSLIELVQSVFGHEEIATMLLDPEATETLKAVHNEIQAAMNRLGEDFDMNTLKEQLAAVSGNKPEKVADEQVKQPIGQIASNIINNRLDTK